MRKGMITVAVLAFEVWKVNGIQEVHKRNVP